MKNVKKEINEVREEARKLRASVEELRNIMESFGIFQQDDEVGTALANVEARVWMVQYKALNVSIDFASAKKVLKNFKKSLKNA